SQMVAAIRRGCLDEASKALFYKHFLDCTITQKKEDLLGNGVEMEYLLVTPIWIGVDRENSGGWSVSKDSMKLAQRLQAAVKSGKAFCDIQVCTDVVGQTYIG